VHTGPTVMTTLVPLIGNSTPVNKRYRINNHLDTLTTRQKPMLGVKQGSRFTFVEA
jgi:hypothetical protein